MFSIKSKYIILIWIIILILFTFYCIFRLKYLKDNSDDNDNDNDNDNKISNNKEKFFDTKLEVNLNKLKMVYQGDGNSDILFDSPNDGDKYKWSINGHIGNGITSYDNLNSKLNSTNEFKNYRYLAILRVNSNNDYFLTFGNVLPNDEFIIPSNGQKYQSATNHLHWTSTSTIRAGYKEDDHGHTYNGRIGCTWAIYDMKSDSSSSPIIEYVNNIQSINKVSDMQDSICRDIKDQDLEAIKLNSLYKNCQDAYADFLAYGYDTTIAINTIPTNPRFTRPLPTYIKSLSDICPVTVKTPEYINCIKSMLQTKTDTANILNNVSTDMTNSINKRLQYRSTVLDDVQKEMNSLLVNKEQADFNSYMKKNNSIAQSSIDKLGVVDKYYQNKYQSGSSQIGNTGASKRNLSIDTEGFESNISNVPIITSNTNISIVSPDIIKLFFGKYKAISGQFIAINDLIITFGTNTTNNVNTAIEQHSSIILTISSDINNLKINYKVNNIDSYASLPNAIKFIISDITVISNTSNSYTIQQLLSTLGLTTPTQLIMVYDEFTSTENILHKTYKIINDNNSTILVLNKV